MKKNLLILIALFTAIIGYSQTFTDTNFITYTVVPNTTTVEITDYDFVNGGSTVNIPATVDYNTVTYSVVAIGNNAIQGNVTTGEQITNLTFALPSNIEVIGDFSFSYNHLTSVLIPDSVTNINFGAFVNNQLTSVEIPNSVTSIGNSAFQVNAITTATIGNSVMSIGNFAFLNNPLTCVISEAITPPTITTGTNDSFGVNRSNINLSIPSSTLADYTNAQWTGFNSIAEGLTGTFVVDYITYQINATPNNEVTVTDYNTAGGTAVSIPASVVSGCTSFSVTEIGNNAFQNKNLTDVSLPNTLTYIGENAFFINNLSAVTIPDSVVTIDDIAFAQNQNMTNLVLGNSVTTIGAASFRFTAINTITIPESVTDIGVVAFGGLGGTSAITDVYCEGLVPPIIATSSALNSDTFNQSRNTIHLHIPANTMGSYVTDTGALWTGFNSVNTLSTSNFELDNQVKVINKSNALEISLANNLTLKNYTIYNIAGANVTQGKETFISTDMLSNGVYILELQFNQGRVTKKFIK